MTKNFFKIITRLKRFQEKPAVDRGQLPRKECLEFAIGDATLKWCIILVQEIKEPANKWSLLRSYGKRSTLLVSNNRCFHV